MRVGGLNPPQVTSSRHLVDPELLGALDAITTFLVTADSLGEIRQAVAGVTVPAPPAPATTSEECFVPGPDGTSLRVLVYAPVTPRRGGALLWLHGGGMVMAKPDGNEPLCRYLAQTASCVVVAVDDRLAPEHPYPAALDDCHAALRWLHGVAGEFGFPNDRIAVAGESGGGCLAAGLTLLACDQPDVQLSAQFLLYPMLDDRTGTLSEIDPLPYAGEFVWTPESNRFAWGAVLGREPGGVDVPIAAAPGRAETLAGVPTTSIFIGDLDLFVGENLRFARNLLRSGVPVKLRVYPGSYHGFVSFAQDARVSKSAFRDFGEAITAHFERSETGF